ncbi:MAG TPA: hypothetical protein VMZ53_01215 [Kofleriaceae bacterium]|nr:hypothetical protein [Kofleriaceae bacterium]
MLRRCALVLVAVTATHARAESPVVGGRSARSIGRAGVGTASDDGGGALLANPAAIARREAPRMQLAVAFLDDEMSWLHSASSPVNRDQSSSRLLPMLAIEGAIGEWIVGAGVVTNTRTERLLRRPGINAPARDYGNTFEYRYDGFAGSFRRDMLVAGAAHRIGDTVAIGLSVSASRVEVSELRRLWAGDTNRKPGGVNEVAGDPTQDVELGMTGSAYTPGVVAGVLIAPESTSLEIAASASWMGPARATGEVTGDGAIPQSQYAVSFDSTAARLEIEQPLTFRTGVRWLSERWIAELGGDLWVVPKRAAAPVWHFDGVRITDATTIGATREVQLAALPSRMSTRTHGALRGALDVELISGFLWATAGYAFATSGTAGTRLSPTFGDLGGHTAAIGLEATAGGFTVTFGAARTWSLRSPEPASAWRLDNPFGTGDAMVPVGTFDGSVDMIGLSIDAELWAPE